MSHAFSSVNLQQKCLDAFVVLEELLTSPRGSTALISIIQHLSYNLMPVRLGSITSDTRGSLKLWQIGAAPVIDTEQNVRDNR